MDGQDLYHEKLVLVVLFEGPVLHSQMAFMHLFPFVCVNINARGARASLKFYCWQGTSEGSPLVAGIALDLGANSKTQFKPKYFSGT